MKKPEIPPSENTRLEALLALNILDTKPEERFDRLTRIAKESLDVPVSIVSLVDRDRQWFKSIIGLDVCETSREVSFCGHAILSDEPLIVPNALEDDRFVENPLVTNEPHIRFYAGIPLKAINGERLGTFCVIDTKPRTLSRNQLNLLIDLGSMVERELSIVHLAINDELTKISNRRGFKILGQHSLNLCTRHGFTSTLVYFDLNNFKQINDKFGHSEGDKVLISFAIQLKDMLRESDVCARVGGDEFVALLGNTTESKAEELVARLHNIIDIYNKNAELGYNIKFSHGTVEYDPRKHSDIKSLINAGDQLMYERKRQQANVINIPAKLYNISSQK